MFKLLRKTPQRFRVLRGPFRGASVLLNPVHGKRQLFGLYEYVLNNWIAEAAAEKSFALDVGANAGYDTYGLAHLLSRGNTRPAEVLAIEPDASGYRGLIEPREWPCYSNCRVEIIESLAGAEVGEGAVTLDGLMAERERLASKAGLIKIDVEGAETDVLDGAKTLLRNPTHDWVVEIHGRDRLIPVCERFIAVGRRFLLRDLPPLPILGPERRSIETFWLTTLRGEPAGEAPPAGEAAATGDANPTA